MSNRPTFKGELEQWVSEYRDTPEFNIRLLNTFRERCFEMEHLRRHREYIEQNNRRGLLMGHGDRSVQYLFSLLVEQMPPGFRFLEIGVYKGQICSLMQLLADVSGRSATIIGITPLFDPITDMGTGQKQYDRTPYIEMMYRDLGLTMNNTGIIDGLSQDPRVYGVATETAPYDILYIDGDHSYDATASDILMYKELLKPGGFLVIDDANTFKNFPRIPDPVHQAAVLWTGEEAVSRAVRDHLETDDSFLELLSCMHVRLFYKKPQP
jgi:hypothetical protein